MRPGVSLKCLAAILCWPVLSSLAYADDVNKPLAVDPIAPYAKQVQVAMASENTNKSTVPANPNPNLNFKAPLITGSKVHEYLGIATLVSTLATAMTAPDCKSNCQSQTHGLHQNLGRTSGVLALATVTTGLIFHWKDMHLIEDGLSDPDTQHWLLGGAGALIMADAISRAPNKAHSREAEAGAAMMLVAIKVNW